MHFFFLLNDLIVIIGEKEFETLMSFIVTSNKYYYHLINNNNNDIQSLNPKILESGMDPWKTSQSQPHAFFYVILFYPKSYSLLRD